MRTLIATLLMFLAWIAAPTLFLEIALASWLRVCPGVGYLWVSGIHRQDFGLGDNDFDSLTGQIMFKLGSF